MPKPQLKPTDPHTCQPEAPGGDACFVCGRDMSRTRPLHVIADEIAALVSKTPGRTPPWVGYAAPYVEALRHLATVDDMFVTESGRTVVLYLLNNLKMWRGEDARRIKIELKAHLGQ